MHAFKLSIKIYHEQQIAHLRNRARLIIDWQIFLMKFLKRLKGLIFKHLERFLVKT